MQTIFNLRPFESHDPVSFWEWFQGRRASLEARLCASVAPGAEASHLTLTTNFGDLLREMRGFDASLTPVLRRGADGGMILIVSADAAVEAFGAAKTLAACAPQFPDWRVIALRPRKGVPPMGRGRLMSLETEDMRVAYSLSNSRMTIAILSAQDVSADPAEARYIARRIVADMLGEEDYALSVADVHFLSWSDWMAATPGGRSVPIHAFTAAFDGVFRREGGAQTRVAASEPVAQVA